MIGVLLGLSLTLVAGSDNSPSIAQEAPDFHSGPWPDRSGDYPIRQTYHGMWQVMDTDPQGLNCRGNIPPGQGSAQVIAQFPQDTLLNAVKRERGVFELEKDQRGFPWLRVRLYEKDGKAECWVRANSQFVVPIKPEVVP
ncbi:MAG: hypothetical protein HC835_19075 [Oscillatoriales cyanobacterium RM2_1_1]|nr:hypothetical protein [Oscillatoriales cyanobacterium SM2_3_0]NJO47533.1 hypothetical protein [Oscillatoriales cyanobacterium RM2_1_1]